MAPAEGRGVTFARLAARYLVAAYVAASAVGVGVVLLVDLAR